VRRPSTQECMELAPSLPCRILENILSPREEAPSRRGLELAQMLTASRPPCSRKVSEASVRDESLQAPRAHATSRTEFALNDLYSTALGAERDGSALAPSPSYSPSPVVPEAWG
jgi:hypothetical protein